jgi:hypothetical protein
MANTFIHGRLTVLKIGSVDISLATKTSTFSGSADVHDTTGYSAPSGARTKAGGLVDGKFTASGLYDIQATTGTPTVLEGKEGTSMTITRQVNGTLTGKPQEVFTAIVSKFDVTDPVDDMVAWSAEWDVSGPVNRAVQ